MGDIVLHKHKKEYGIVNRNFKNVLIGLLLLSFKAVPFKAMPQTA